MPEQEVGGRILTPGRRRPRFRVPPTLAWLAVTPLAAWAVVRLAGVEHGSIPDQLMTATPYAAAGSVASLLLAALSKRRAVTVIALGTTVAFGAGVLPRAFGSATTIRGTSLKIMSINLFFGQGSADAVVDLVRRLRPDVLSTQELTPGAVADLDAAGLKELMPYRVLEAEWSAGGSGLFARYPLTRLGDLFHPPVGHNMPAARLDLPTGQTVEIVDVHTLPPLGPQTTTWVEGLRSLPSGPAKGPFRILAGDFNASLDHAELRRTISRGYTDAGDATGKGLIPTWPANKRKVPPLITIDHVLADRRIGIKRYEVRTVPRTDHRSIFAELILPAG